MVSSCANQESSPKDRGWCFLARYPLNERLPDQAREDALFAGWLAQTTRELTISFDFLHQIERALIEYVKQTRALSNHGNRDLAIVIRLFVRNKMLEPGKPFRASGFPQQKQTTERAQTIPPECEKRVGGWGFFIIEKGRGLSSGSMVGSKNMIDLYLYQEVALQTDEEIRNEKCVNEA